METITVLINQQAIGELFYEKKGHQYGFNYTKDISPVSLIMPFKKSTYLWQNKLHPIFDMNMPEGYLFEIFKNFLSKEHGYIDDFLIFSYLSPNIQGRIHYRCKKNDSQATHFDLDEVLRHDNKDTFTKILNCFLNKNAISGVQPKTLALLEDKASLVTKEYIIKTWGNEYPQLALNEYFCLKAVQKTGVKIPHIKLSNNNNFLLVERFNYNKQLKEYMGFEEVLVLQGKNKDEKYSGSYESVAKLVYAVSTDKQACMVSLYKIIVMNYLLKNGDAHLKNFAIIYDQDIAHIRLSPAYDIVNTSVYIYNDRPALTLFGKKIWFNVAILNRTHNLK
ncbi:type II toxin-antitoxin system HipA family toxin [sulfur-oxidizing endosymbiont of Gigantopelta aegis]|uniref:type II toxin-antitoxin system HipA family toxin n=1 Tax=sulfur-oxidizing endosymbiont of Gigantopelta aegis TaxID=2794934 RepID=UPI0018DD347F|nr:type II toxin-antitoxin system HipA family toxin [sulfur-oxidizing endosymbiont of Gigantopelta aegis]